MAVSDKATSPPGEVYTGAPTALSVIYGALFGFRFGNPNSPVTPLLTGFELPQSIAPYLRRSFRYLVRGLCHLALGQKGY